MQRTIVVVLAMVLGSWPAPAGQPKAMVKAHGEYRWLVSESVPCGMVLEGVLRDRGFEVIERTLPESKAGLVITVDAHCDRIWSRPASVYHQLDNPSSNCSASASVRGPAVRNSRLRGHGDSNTGHLQALSAACRQIAEQLDRKLGGGGKIDDAESRRADPSRQKLRLVFVWKGELTPMPLITLTGFFQKAGYEAKLVQGGAQRCVFEIVIEEELERFAHLLTTYLDSQYRVAAQPGGAKQLSYRLEGR